MGMLKRAFGYQGDHMDLPVQDLAVAVTFYETVLGFRVLSREDGPVKGAILARDDVQMRLAENGRDPTQDGCAFHVEGLDSLFAEFQANGLGKKLSAFDRDEHDSTSFRVFYVVAPDGLCYWFGEPLPPR